MSRQFFVLVAALALAVPASGSAQSTASEQAQERAERDREREQERAERIREQAQERAERIREQAQERAEHDRERAQERRERDAAGALDTTVAFAANGTLNVGCAGGDVIVTATDRNEIRVRARTERGAIRFTSSGSNATLEPASSRSCSDGRFEVSVPAGIHLVASTWSGSVSVKGVRGEIEAHAQSGDVEVRDAGDRLEVETLSGDVTVQGVKGDANIHTLSGDVTLDGARGNVEVETVSGDIELHDVVARQVRTNSTSGDLTFGGTILANGRYEFTTHSGELRLQLPRDIGAQLSLSTFSGEIDSAFPITLKAGEHGIGSSQAKKLNFSLGQGTARIIAETFSGDVTLTTTGRRP
ncbi:MAG TPA: DUF4097 family beta strand repeat-containing protein [Gemmatimonadaceae bacterium]|jgi:DUF4097 and DUF4098 domain-containing protein YvlB|nr:DUF4097 family beta strand repeat-containing protein [Gemmatimonadaceae bacterium]